MWQKILIVVLVLLSAGVGVLLGYGGMRWNKETQTLRHRLESARLPLLTKTFDARELDALPAPVRRYFQTALTPGQAMISALDIEQAGTFNKSEGHESWSPFTSTQRVGVASQAAPLKPHQRCHNQCVNQKTHPGKCHRPTLAMP